LWYDQESTDENKKNENQCREQEFFHDVFVGFFLMLAKIVPK